MARRRTLRKKQKTYTKSINKKRKQTYRKMRGGNGEDVHQIIDELTVILNALQLGHDDIKKEIKKCNKSKDIEKCKTLNIIYAQIKKDITNTKIVLKNAATSKAKSKAKSKAASKAAKSKAASEKADTSDTSDTLCCGRRRRKYNKSRRHHKRK